MEKRLVFEVGELKYESGPRTYYVDIGSVSASPSLCFVVRDVADSPPAGLWRGPRWCVRAVLHGEHVVLRSKQEADKNKTKNNHLTEISHPRVFGHSLLRPVQVSIHPCAATSQLAVPAQHGGLSSGLPCTP